MDAQIKNQGSSELAERIKNSLAEPQHRFQLHDPFAETTHRFPNAETARSKADELNASRIQHVAADGKVSQVNKVDGDWKREDGKTLAEVQADIDKESLKNIEARAELRVAAGQGVDAETDKQMARADAHAFRRIHDQHQREDAAIQMAENARKHPEYKSGLDTAIPGYPGTAERVYALDAANTDKVMAKHDRKALEYASMVAEAESKNSVEPNNEKAQQRLDGDEDAKRSAWLKKAEESKPIQPASTAKAASDNQVESDEIFTARQAEVRPAVPPEVEKKYLRVGDKFYYPNNTEQAAFEDKGNKLETKSNSENVAESMVRIAEARGWDEIKVSGTETFRKEVWLEAASRGMHVKGYAPSEQDKAELAKRTREIDPKVEKENRPFRGRENEDEAATPSQRRANAFANETPADAVKLHPELAGAAAVLAATAKQAEADGLNPAQRAIVSARVRQNVVNSIERGELPAVKIKDEVEVKQDRKEEREAMR